MLGVLAVAGLAPLEPFVEVPPEVDGVLDEPEVLLEEDELLDELDSDGSEGRGLESVTYQPEPLKMMPAG